MNKERRFLVFGAHPDDPDLMFGGTALKLIANGHKVKFVSVANGDCGHFNMTKEDLAARRYQEAQDSAEIAGLSEYQVLDNGDCVVENSLANREQIVRIIREFAPDVVISHRLCDYHVDHRTTAQLVQDASFLVTVPLYSPETPIPEEYPIFAYSWDRFTQPPFDPDIVVEIDSVLDDKLRMLDCHKSQFYEWLPWLKGYKDFDVAAMSSQGKRKWLMDNWICRDSVQRESYNDKVMELYPEDHSHIKYVESFQITEYGRYPEPDELRNLFL